MDEYNPRSEEYQAFLNKKHGSLVTSDSLIEEVVKEIVGSRLVSKSRIIKGEANEVYSGETEDSQQIIIRISRKGFAKFEREKWAIDQCLKEGILVPRVIGIKDCGNSNKKLNFCIETLLEGKPLDEMLELRNPSNKSKLDDIMKQAGEMLSKIHNVSTNGFGEFDKDGNTNSKSIKDFFSGSPYVSTEKMVEVSKRASLEEAIMTTAVRLLNSLIDDCAIESSQLVHGDWAPKHILVKDGHVSGIIDFECAEGSDPIRDFAYWEYFSGDTYHVQAMKEGYLNKEIFDASFEKRFKLWQLYIGITTLEYYVEENHTSGIRHSKEKLTELTTGQS